MPAATMPTTLPTPSPHDTPWPISTVERETGLGKDSLRVWERRYGFPTPARSATGERLYSPQQVLQLKLIARLLDAGLRPGKVVGLAQPDLEALLAQYKPLPSATLSKTNDRDSTDPLIEELLHAIASHQPHALKNGLSRALLRMGLAPFVTELVVPLTAAVGEAWAQGRFEVFEEHLYTEVISGVLRHAIASLPPQPEPLGPKVLLTTLPPELHGLGLLMVEALLVLDGCTCVSLGTQTPLLDVVQAAQAHQVDVVILSFSAAQTGTLALNNLRELRRHLPPAVALWAGGSCPALYRKPLAGISTMQPLSALKPLVQQWRDKPTLPTAQ